jgi:hypothetical protein
MICRSLPVAANNIISFFCAVKLYIFLIHSSVVGHLHCFHRMAVVGLFLVFWGTYIWLSIVFVLITFPQCIKVPFPPTSLLSFAIACVFADSHSDWKEVKSQCFLICISFMVRDVDHFFMYLLVICTYSFKNCLFSSFAHSLSCWFFWRLVFFFFF